MGNAQSNTEEVEVEVEPNGRQEPERALPTPRTSDKMWTWSSRAPDTPNASAHGGKAFGRETNGPNSGREGSQHNGGSLWDWGNGRKSPAATPNPSAHGGNAFARQNSTSMLWDWGYRRKDDPASSPVGTPGNSAHGGVSFWNWSVGRAPDPNTTPGGTPSASRNASTHGAMLWDWSKGRTDPAPTPNPSAHGGSNFAPGSRGNSTHGGGILRNVNWPGTSPSVSRGNSLHGGVHFARQSVENAKERDGPNAPPPGSPGLVRKMSVTSMWDWGLGRTEPESAPASPAPGSPPAERVMKRQDSSVWDWGLGRSSKADTPMTSPAASRDARCALPDRPTAHMHMPRAKNSCRRFYLGALRPPCAPERANCARSPRMHVYARARRSLHNGEGKEMPWAIKIKFGSDSERPV